MAATHNEDIKDLLSVIPVIPDKLMIEYLMRRFDMTPNRARETIYNACRQYAKKKPVCYATNGGLARYNDLAMNSKIMQQCRAFRVACEFLPESRAFSLPKLHPWLLNFCEDGHAYYVCEFKRGEELLLSDMIRSTGIQQEMRPVTRRVAILAPGANRSLISECGIKFFCTVDDEWDLAVTESVPDDEVSVVSTCHLADSVRDFSRFHVIIVHKHCALGFGARRDVPLKDEEIPPVRSGKTAVLVHIGKQRIHHEAPHFQPDTQCRITRFLSAGTVPCTSFAGQNLRQSDRQNGVFRSCDSADVRWDLQWFFRENVAQRWPCAPRKFLPNLRFCSQKRVGNRVQVGIIEAGKWCVGRLFLQFLNGDFQLFRNISNGVGASHSPSRSRDSRGFLLTLSYHFLCKPGPETAFFIRRGHHSTPEYEFRIHRSRG